MAPCSSACSSSKTQPPISIFCTDTRTHLLSSRFLVRSHALLVLLAISHPWDLMVVHSAFLPWRSYSNSQQGSRHTTSLSNFNLEANESLLLTFSGKPLLKPSGFWSLSIYGADQYLIKNKLSRFSISDRSTNLTYLRSGEKVNGGNDTADGPFQVLIQNANVTSPANWTGNCLPGAQAFSFIGEFYEVLN
jgi:hypothetical protein